MPDVQVKTECLMACREMTIDSAYKVRCRTDACSWAPSYLLTIRSENRAETSLGARWYLCL